MPLSVYEILYKKNEIKVNGIFLSKCFLRTSLMLSPPLFTPTFSFEIVRDVLSPFLLHPLNFANIQGYLENLF